MIRPWTLALLCLGLLGSLPVAAQTGFYFGGTLGNTSVNTIPRHQPGFRRGRFFVVGLRRHPGDRHAGS
ncbi:MAG: hypothetical protein U5K76_00655 [Woeseiaceae bacterium]|nr:hypothetical protein [Woeseiaceae bacterium]